MKISLSHFGGFGDWGLGINNVKMHKQQVDSVEECIRNNGILRTDRIVFDGVESNDIIKGFKDLCVEKQLTDEIAPIKLGVQRARNNKK